MYIKKIARFGEVGVLKIHSTGKILFGMKDTEGFGSEILRMTETADNILVYDWHTYTANWGGQI